MKVSVFSLWRDSEERILGNLRVLEELEKYSSDVEFEYFFYENDSKDKTPEILSNWLGAREGRLLSEKLDYPKFGSVISHERFRLMAEYRNKMLKLGKPLSSDYSLIWDSDIKFEPDILEKYLQIKHDDWAMLAPNIRQNIRCKMQPSDGDVEDSYYDVIALFTRESIMGMYFSDCPFFDSEDRKKWFNGEPVGARTAFGGAVLVKSKILEKCVWGTNGGVEHLLWCEDLNKYGKIYVMPNIRPFVEIPDKMKEEVNKAYPENSRLLTRQKRVVHSTAWERSLALKAPRLKAYEGSCQPDGLICPSSHGGGRRELLSCDQVAVGLVQVGAQFDEEHVRKCEEDEGFNGCIDGVDANNL